MISVLRMLAHLGILGGLLGGAAYAVALELADVSQELRALVREGERRRALELQLDQIGQRQERRRQIAEEWIEGKRRLEEAAFLYRELNRSYLPENYCPLGLGDSSEDEWLCRQVKEAVMTIARKRSATEAERLAKKIETEVESYREQDGRVQLPREASLLASGGR